MPRFPSLAGSSRWLCLALACADVRAAENTPAFLDYIKAEAAALRKADAPPPSLADWQQQRTSLRAQMLAAWGGFPAQACALEPRKLGELSRDGYRVEKIIFQTFPGVWMTANAYVPDRAGKVPAVLAVHGHWPGAKEDPVVQSRCIGLAKLGFFVLAVDAFGAGERGVGKALGEYHGDMTAATLLPVGLTLSGIQVYENARAVDYLLTRPEVDGARLGITGASGGGNQSLYAGAWDERLRAVVPVCSVGNYQAYLGVGCCLCEVVPGALRFTEEWRVLSLVSPRALLVLNATRDSVQFSVPEARKSLGPTRHVFQLQGQADHLEHVAFDSPHAYNQPMRETMYGWMTRHLKAEGDGAPLAEPAVQTADPETLRCFPGDSRPDDYVTLPRFAAREAQAVLARFAVAAASASPDERARMLQQLARCVYGGDGTPPAKMPADAVEHAADASGLTLRFASERSITLSAREQPNNANTSRIALLLDLQGAKQAAASDAAGALRAAGWNVVTFDLRATGELAVAKARVGRAPDHNPAEWSLWIGRPLLGQWVGDVQRLIDALQAVHGSLPRDLAVVGLGPAGLLAEVAAALDPRITRVAAIGSLASYVTDVPYEKQWLGLMAPGILRDVGDIAHIAALIAPRKLVVAAGVNGRGETLSADALARGFEFTRRTYGQQRADGAFVLAPELNAADLPQQLD